MRVSAFEWWGEAPERPNAIDRVMSGSIRVTMLGRKTRRAAS